VRNLTSQEAIGVEADKGKRGKKVKDMKGRGFGSWLVTDSHRIFLVHGKRRTYWPCRCVCGDEKLILSQSLTSGVSTSCGCQRPLLVKISNIERFGNTNRVSKHIRYQYFDRLKNRTQKMSPHLWSEALTEEYLDELFLKQNFKCALSGIDIGFEKNHYAGMSASLDRIDSSKGYAVGNVQWTHKFVNRMKNNYDQAYFIRLCKAVAAHNT
jgi:hypothetical protein